MPTLSTLDIGALIAALALLFIAIVRRRQQLPLPPGPRGWPLLGNLLELPHKEEWLQYTDWAETYGPIFSLNLLGKTIIVINTAEAAFELFDRRSSKYSSRITTTMLYDLMRFDWAFVIQPYGDRWRKHRAMLHRELHPTAAATYRPAQLLHTRTLIQLLASDPSDWQVHLQRTSTAIIMDIAYGHIIAPSDDPYVKLAKDAVEQFNEGARPGRWLVDFLPFLQHVPTWAPGGQFKKHARHARTLSDAVRDVPFDDVREKMRTGTARPSFVTRMLSSLSSTPSSEDLQTIKNVSAMAYGAGAESTSAALATFILALATHPHVQTRAQQEIDRVLGTGRLPDFGDRESLPYIEAVKKEVLRWRPVTPIAVPHATNAEDEYMGYRIPAGAIVIGNAWAMLHDSSIYPDPWRFEPARFLTKDNMEFHDPRFSCAFGFGRRICLGRYLADNSIWIGVASILAAFEISPPLDPTTGREVDLMETVEWSTGLTSHPEKFDVRIKVRKGWEDAIRTDLEMST